MATLNVESLHVTSFAMTSATALPSVQSHDCVSPLCMTEGRECTTPWCKDDAQPGIEATAG